MSAPSFRTRRSSLSRAVGEIWDHAASLLRKGCPVPTSKPRRISALAWVVAWAYLRGEVGTLALKGRCFGVCGRGEVGGRPDCGRPDCGRGERGEEGMTDCGLDII